MFSKDEIEEKIDSLIKAVKDGLDELQQQFDSSEQHVTKIRESVTEIIGSVKALSETTTGWVENTIIPWLNDHSKSSQEESAVDEQGSESD